MKEIGKLLELIKKFRIETQGDKELKKVERGETAFLFRYQPYVGGELQKGMTLFEETLISKSFGFIKWLVENDKIDTSKANDKNLNGYEIELRIRAVKELVADSEEKTVLYLNLLMLLAIQDEPIEFLCSLLK